MERTLATAASELRAIMSVVLKEVKYIAKKDSCRKLSTNLTEQDSISKDRPMLQAQVLQSRMQDQLRYHSYCFVVGPFAVECGEALDELRQAVECLEASCAPSASGNPLWQSGYMYIRDELRHFTHRKSYPRVGQRE